ncbi:hypothetical protein B0H17DRAFT_1202460 [Mycena rosella]|uniref:Uncharacterized protein n=1 Tax=Mycena rosella TaxID=1033263 RepID=A0AAD7DGZ3_MYCRO|nr:hypothetical protein B0H17DRAFT_1202460 [Mycena rosella]
MKHAAPAASAVTVPSSPTHAPLPTHSSSPSTCIGGEMAYAVKHGNRSVVFDDYHGAQELYHRLQVSRGSPSLATSLSLTEGVSSLEGFSLGEVSAVWQSWTGKEHKARGARVVKCWETAMDGWSGTCDSVWISDLESEALSLSRSAGAGRLS